MNSKRIFLGFALAASIAIIVQANAQPPSPGVQKKLIEYGWDVPTPDFIAKNIAAMEERPFDGLIFKLKAGCNVLEPAAMDPALLAEDYALLPTIAWKKFTDNFVIMWAASNQDWFNDDHWKAIEGNVRLVSKAARLAGCVGICFDAEPYGTNPWSYKDAAHRDTITFAEYQIKARQRGAQFIQAVQSELSHPAILTFFLLSLFGELCKPMDPMTREQALSENGYALLPAFLEGMITSAENGTTIIDGNEPAYYYTDKAPYFDVFQLVAERGRHMIAPALWEDYRRVVRPGQALYVDQYFGLRTDKTLGNFMDPAGKAQWFEHNVFWSLYTTDRYVWCYSERMNWWTNTDIPEGSEAAARAARNKIETGQPLGFDLAPVMEAARQKQANPSN